MAITELVRRRDVDTTVTPNQWRANLSVDRYDAPEGTIRVARAQRPVGPGSDRQRLEYCAWLDDDAFATGPVRLGPGCGIRGQVGIGLGADRSLLCTRVGSHRFDLVFGSATYRLGPVRGGAELTTADREVVAQIPSYRRRLLVDWDLAADSDTMLVLLGVLGSGLAMHAQSGGLLRWSALGRLA